MLLSPYPPELHQSALAFLTASGFNVVADHTEDVVFKRLQDVTPAHIAAAAARLLKSAPEADGIYIPCNQWSAADAAPIIERETGLPVVTGSHADHWEAFRMLGINDPIEGHGRLMASLSKQPARADERIRGASMNTFARSILAFVAILLTCPVGTHAQDFPNKPVRFVVPYAAGGSGDLLARLLGEKLGKLWGQQVVIDNKPGAGGLIGTEFAARADADGYTIYLATDGPITIAPTLHSKPLSYDWKRDFAPVSMIAVGYQILLNSPTLPPADLKSFIALAKANPGKYNFASIGVGSAPHLSAEFFLSEAGLKLTHVPYRGSSAQAITALIAGDVAMFVVGTSTAVPFVKAGTVRGLAVTAPKRIDSLPDVPTFAELGMPSVDYSIWFAVLAPSATPQAIVKKLNQDIAKVVADPEYKATLHARGFEAVANTPEQLAVFLDKDYVQIQELDREARAEGRMRAAMSQHPGFQHGRVREHRTSGCGRERALADAGRHRGEAGLRPRRREGARLPRDVPGHPAVPARPLPDHVRHPAVDHPAVRGLLDGGGLQRLLSPQPRGRPKGPLDRVRSADPPRL